MGQTADRKLEKVDFLNPTGLIKSVDREGKKTYLFVASTSTVDRQGHLMKIDEEAVDLENFKKNPVILFAHDRWTPPIGKAVDVYIEDGKLLVEVELADTDEAQKIKKLLDGGFIKAVSIGGRVKECYASDGFLCKDKKDLEKDYPEFFKKYATEIAKADVVITKWELYEVSIVPIPANPDAMLVMKSCGLDNCLVATADGDYQPFDLSMWVIKTAIPYSVHGKLNCIDDKTSWSKERAIATLRKWASKDGSGDPDTIDFTKYKKGFAWYDKEKPKNLTSYKFPHHIAKDGKLCVHRRGVITAMAFLFKPNVVRTYSEEDRKEMYKHLAKHYKDDLGKEPPEFKEAGLTLDDAYSLYKAGKLDEETFEVFLSVYPYTEDGEIDDDLAKELKDFLTKTLDERDALKKQVEDLQKQIKDLKAQLEKTQQTQQPQPQPQTQTQEPQPTPTAPQPTQEPPIPQEVLAKAVMEALGEEVGEIVKKLLSS